MKVKVLGSGSKGNSTYIEYKDTKILIDVGLRCSYIEKELKSIDVDCKDIDAIFITHVHSDHILGLNSFIKKYKTPIYIGPNMDELKCYNNICISSEMDIKDINVKSFKTSHDVESFGFIVNDELVYITDTGYINSKYFDLLKNKKIYIMESNHDVEMLETGPYPYYLKQRIWSSKGHLSNKASADYLNKLIGNNTKCVILAHLSETNNNSKLAIEEFNNKNKVDLLLVAEQNKSTELVEV